MTSVNRAQDFKQKLSSLSQNPGVYFYKDINGEIIYIGKAAKLKRRVSQYFQKSRFRDPKTEALISEIYDLEWMEVDSEIDALFLEAELIRRYLPKYNILLRDDKSLVYIRIDYASDYPTVSYTRRPLDDGARYFGPYNSAVTIKQALRLLRKVFPYATKRNLNQKRPSLHYYIGLDPGLETGRTSLADYRLNLRRLMAFINGKRSSVIMEIEKDMQRAAKEKDFETAARLRDQLAALKSLNQKIIFSDKEFIDLSKDQALTELVALLTLKNYPRRIEGYDISHMQGTDVVASMVVFTNGTSNKAQYRKFKTTHDINNDFFNMNETIYRRLSDKNLTSWGKPDLLLIDGGKGQLDAAINARDKRPETMNLPIIGLAKREEQIVIDINRSHVSLNYEVMHQLGGHATSSDNFILINISKSSNIVKLLQRIRDESHRFAVSYHSSLKRKRVKHSLLETINGIGPVKSKMLLKQFGSIEQMKQLNDSELEVFLSAAQIRTIRKLT